MEFFLCFIATAMQELLHWIDIKQELDHTIDITGSLTYWLLSLSFLTLFSLLSFFILKLLGITDFWFFILIALTLPEFFRKVIKIILGWIYPEKSLVLTSEKVQFKVKDYFRKS